MSWLDRIALGVGNATSLQGYGVATTAPSSGQILTWNGTNWTPTSGAAGGVTSVLTCADGGSVTFGPDLNSVCRAAAASSSGCALGTYATPTNGSIITIIAGGSVSATNKITLTGNGSINVEQPVDALHTSPGTFASTAVFTIAWASWSLIYLSADNHWKLL